jgi:hypothetical protein
MEIVLGFKINDPAAPLWLQLFVQQRRTGLDKANLTFAKLERWKVC